MSIDLDLPTGTSYIDPNTLMLNMLANRHHRHPMVRSTDYRLALVEIRPYSAIEHCDSGISQAAHANQMRNIRNEKYLIFSFTNLNSAGPFCVSDSYNIQAVIADLANFRILVVHQIN